MSSATNQNTNATWGLLAEYADVGALLKAAARIRDAGFSRWECYTPFPVHGLDKAMGAKHTRLPWLVLLCGILGCLSGLLLSWYTNATSYDGVPYALRGYEFVISGKPFWSLPANIPPIFELTILFSAFGAFFGMLAFNGLPRFYHPTARSRRFGRVTSDRFFIAIEAADPKFDRTATANLLRDTGSDHVEALED